MQKRGHWSDWLSRNLAALAILTAAVRLLHPASTLPAEGAQAIPAPTVVDAEAWIEWAVCPLMVAGARSFPGLSLPAEVSQLADVVRCSVRFSGPATSSSGKLSGSLRWEIDGATTASRRTVRGDGAGTFLLTPAGVGLDEARLVTREVVDRRSPRFSAIYPQMPADFRENLPPAGGSAMEYAAELTRSGGALAALDLDGKGLPSLLAARGRQAVLLQNRGALRFEARRLSVSPVPGGYYVAAIPLAGKTPRLALVSSTLAGPARVELRLGPSLEAGPALELDAPVATAAADGAQLFLAGPKGIDRVDASASLSLGEHFALAGDAIDATFADVLALGRPQLLLAGLSGALAWDPQRGETKLLAPGSFVSIDAGDAHGRGQAALLAAGLGEWRDRALALGVPQGPLASAAGTSIASAGDVAHLADLASFSFAGVLADFDDDGRLEVALATGLASAASSALQEERYLRELATGDKVEGNKSARLFGWQQKRLLHARAGGGYEEAGFAEGLDEMRDGRSLLAVDLDGDGRLDLAMLGRDWPALVLFHNRGAAGNALALHLTDQAGNPAGPGAVVRVLDAPPGQARAFTAAAGRGYHAASLGPVHASLGAMASARVEIRWASGATQELGDLAHGAWEVHEGSAPVKRESPRAEPPRQLAPLTAASLGLSPRRPGAALLAVQSCGVCRAAAARLASLPEAENAVVLARSGDPATLARELGVAMRAAAAPARLDESFARPLEPGALLLFDRSGSLRRVLRDPRAADSSLEKPLASAGSPPARGGR